MNQPAMSQLETSKQASGGKARAIAIRTWLAAVFVGLASSSCGATGPYIWVDEAPATFFGSPPELLIARGDVVSVRVFGQEPLSVRGVVRSDGVIVMPLIGNVTVVGKTSDVVAKEVETRLQPYVTNPNVVVVVEESHIRIVAIGEVRKTGTITLDATETGLLAAIANAGGLTDFASESRIFVIRSERGTVYRIRFQYDDITRGVGRAAEFRLRSGDQLVVE